ncbi:MAG: hypothetical protein M3015_03910 [Bacteroidota bacterium]|nr:hypothetical protein [Bacteroidota bacterium]
MSIDNIQLPAFLQKALFKNNLVGSQMKSGNNSTNTTKASIDFLGGNSKNIAFIVNNNESKFLNDNQLTFALGLIKACNMSLDDIAVVNLAQYQPLTYADLVSQLSCCKILSFGVAAADLDLPFTIPFYQMQNFQETDYLFCPSLNELQEDTNAKKQLWSSLQKIFKINK